MPVSDADFNALLSGSLPFVLHGAPTTTFFKDSDLLLKNFNNLKNVEIATVVFY